MLSRSNFVPSATSLQYLRVLELDVPSQAVFQLQGPKPEAAIYNSRTPLSSTREREVVLRQAESGNYYAMKRLGEYLVAQNAFEDRARGLNWLRRASETGFPSAQLCLGEHLLDGMLVPRNREEGEMWLRKAAQSGYLRAVTRLAVRMIHGAGVDEQPDRGVEMLCEAAIEGWIAAAAVLAAQGFEGGESSSAEAAMWLERCGVSQAEEAVKIALFLYLDSWQESASWSRAQFTHYAGVLLEQMLKRGAGSAAINLAFLVRRGELSSGRFPSLAELLDPLLGSKDPFVLINQALRMAAGIDLERDWRSADSLVGGITDTQAVLNWWRARAHGGDTEGHLVIAWLLRHKLRTDPDGLGLGARVGRANAGGWDVPQWFITPAYK
jgi:hypothetical protein